MPRKKRLTQMQKLYMEQIERLSPAVKQLEKRGYIVSSEFSSLPSRVTRKRLQAISLATPEYIKKISARIVKTTGEVKNILNPRQIGAIKAAETRKRKAEKDMLYAARLRANWERNLSKNKIKTVKEKEIIQPKDESKSEKDKTNKEIKSNQSFDEDEYDYNYSMPQRSDTILDNVISILAGALNEAKRIDWMLDKFYDVIDEYGKDDVALRFVEEQIVQTVNAYCYSSQAEVVYPAGLDILHALYKGKIPSYTREEYTDIIYSDFNPFFKTKRGRKLFIEYFI